MKKSDIKCLDLLKKLFIATIRFIAMNENAVPLKCVSMNNQKCEKRPAIRNINSNGPLFNPYSVSVNKCSGRRMLLQI